MNTRSSSAEMKELEVKNLIRNTLAKNMKYGPLLPEKSGNINTIITAFTTAEYAIRYAITLSTLILNGVIKSSDFDKIDIPNKFGKTQWQNNPEQFREQTQNLPMAVFAFEIIKCVEGYRDLFVGRKSIDPSINFDLHSAQMILRIIRNCFGHPLVHDNQVQIKWNVEHVEYKKRFEVKEIGIILDARELDGKQFTLKEIGGDGWENLFKLLNYLKNDLQSNLPQ